MLVIIEPKLRRADVFSADQGVEDGSRGFFFSGDRPEDRHLGIDLSQSPRLTDVIDRVDCAMSPTARAEAHLGQDPIVKRREFQLVHQTMLRPNAVWIVTFSCKPARILQAPARYCPSALARERRTGAATRDWGRAPR